MRHRSTTVLLSLLFSCLAAPLAEAGGVSVESPGRVHTVTLELVDGAPYYRVEQLGRTVVADSRLGLELRSGPSFMTGFKRLSAETVTIDETWEQPWGERRYIRNHGNGLKVELADAAGGDRWLRLYFRAYDDGVAFRYELPAQPGLDTIEVVDELTEFALTGDHRSWSIPAFGSNRYEYTYVDQPLSETDHETYHTPLTMRTADGLHISIHEAALTDYSSMALERKGNHTLKARLFPWSDGTLVKAERSLVSPWRTIQMADRAGGLIESGLILNLNEPNVLEDISWVKPGKYIGVWWELHLNKTTWGTGERHGATTENVKHYIDFAAEHGFDGVLVEGWNTGWDGDWQAHGAESFNFTQPTPDFDVDFLASYAQAKGTRLIGHHETSGGIANYERQLEDAFQFLNKHGMRAVKTGYVAYGNEIKRPGEDGAVLTEWHHGQWMVRHYRRVVEMAARYKVMLNVHEPIKPTGIRRTYPHMMTREGAKGQEYNAWGDEQRNPPEHTVVLPFTRLLAGPMDFTPGIFDLTFAGTDPEANRVSTTLAKQLALYVVIHSPLQMAADLPETYAARMDAFQFIKDVPADWHETRVLDAAIGDYVAMARRDRHSSDWYLGAITDEQGRFLRVPLSFLAPGQDYEARIYRDADDADWLTNPHAVRIETRLVTSADMLPLRLAPGGGTAVRFVRK